MPDLYSSAWEAHLNREDPLESGLGDPDPRRGNVQAKLLKASGRRRAREWAAGGWGRSAPTLQLSVLPAGSADRKGDLQASSPEAVAQEGTSLPNNPSERKAKEAGA